jgi:hypothetical protein
MSIVNSQIQGNVTGGTGAGIDATGTTLFLTHSTVNGNVSAGNGAGIELTTTGTVAGGTGSSIIDTTLTANLALNNADVNGGGIDAEGTGDIKLLCDTINANFAGNGGGVFWSGTAGIFAVQNTILAANFFSPDGTGPDADNPAGTFTDNGGNLIGIAGAGSGNTGFTAGTTQKGTVAMPLKPLLLHLANNGGPTVGSPGESLVLETEALAAGSPALTKGILSGLPPTDERGFPCTVGGKTDVGAFGFYNQVLPRRLPRDVNECAAYDCCRSP